MIRLLGRMRYPFSLRTSESVQAVDRLRAKLERRLTIDLIDVLPRGL